MNKISSFFLNKFLTLICILLYIVASSAILCRQDSRADQPPG